jgi:hypothetical protein
MLRAQVLSYRSLERDGLSSYLGQSHDDASEVSSENLKSFYIPFGWLTVFTRFNVALRPYDSRFSGSLSESFPGCQV